VLFLAAIGIFVFNFAVELRYAVESSIDSQLDANLTAVRLAQAEILAAQKGGKENRFTIIFVGDVMLSRGVAAQIKRHNDQSFPFLKIADALKGANIVFGNLEGPISARGKNQGSEYSFRANPEVIQGLVFAGFDVISLANNHIWDWGADALQDTTHFLRDAGIGTVGAGSNEKEANAPFVANLGGTKVAFLAYTNLLPESLRAWDNRPGVSDFDIGAIKRKIRSLRDDGDIVVVSLHWGEEYAEKPSNAQREIAHELVDAGTDMIIGYHPHVIQEVEEYGDGWIAYSLGNFVFDQNFSEETVQGLLIRVNVEAGKVESFSPEKITISDTFQPLEAGE